MNDDLPLRLAQLSLPLPIEPVTEEVLASSEAGVRHRNAVRAWEVVIQLAASAVWAVSKKLGLRSPGFDLVSKGLRRPSMGHWAGLLREGASLLSNRKDAAVLPLEATLAALHGRADEPELVALVEAMANLPQPVLPSGRRVIDVIEAMTTYRSRSEGHPDERPGMSVLHDNAEAMVHALIRFLEIAPVIGTYKLVVAHRVRKQQDGGFTIERITMHRGRGSWDQVPLSAEAGGALREGGLYLWSRDAVVSLWPIAAAEQTDSGWRVGLLKSEVRGPLFSYAPFVERAFKASLTSEEYQSLIGDSKIDRDDLVSEDLLAMEPYLGLLSYDERHAPMFFGRAPDVSDALSVIDQRGSVILCGASGSGKSSLMKAGIVKELRGAKEPSTFLPILLTPGRDPIQALRTALSGVATASGATDLAAVARWRESVEEALPKSGEPKPALVGHLLAAIRDRGMSTVLCIDQLEETSTQVFDAEVRRRFLDVVAHLFAAAKEIGVPVVATVRADHLHTLLEHAGVRSAMEPRLMLLGGLDRARIMEVITGPIRGRRVAIEPGLAEEIAADVGDEPGRLALLSQVLKSLWETRGQFGSGLTKAGYEAVGRVEGAVRDRAESRWSTLDAPQKAILERVFLRLANLTAEGFVRNRVPLAELAEVAGVARSRVEQALAGFVEDRLIVVTIEDGSTVVEVAHEALLRSWTHLADLLRAEQEGIALRREVATAAAAWALSGERREHWTDASTQLLRAEELLSVGRLRLTGDEAAFLSASRRYVDRKKTWARLAVLALAVLAIMAGTLAELARISERQADGEKKRAEELVQKIIHGMREKLVLVDRVDLMADAAESVHQYYEGAPPEVLENPDSRRLQSLAMSTLGNARDQQGRYDDALALYRGALELDRELARTSSSAAADSDLWVSLKNLASFWQRHGKVDEAIVLYVEALSIMEKRAGRSPDDLDVERKLVIAHEDLGRVKRQKGDLEGALDELTTARGIASRLVEREPGNEVWQRDLSDELVLIADLRVEQGLIDDAFSALSEARDGLRRAQEVNPGSAGLVVTEAAIWNRTGDLLRQEGKLAESLAAHEVALGRIGSITKGAMDPSLSSERSVALVGMARVKQARREWADAKKSLAEARRIRLDLSDRDPTSAAKLRDLSEIYALLGAVNAQEGRPNDALEAFLQDLEIADRLVETDPERVAWKRDLSMSLALVGRMKLDLGSVSEAFAAFDRSLELRRSLVALDGSDVAARAALADLYADLGEAYDRIGKRELAVEHKRLAVDERRRTVELAKDKAELRFELGLSEVRLAQALGATGDIAAHRDMLLEAVVSLDMAFGLEPQADHARAASLAFDELERIVAKLDRAEAERIISGLAARGGALEGESRRASIELRVQAMALAHDALRDPELAYQLSVPLRQSFPDSMTVVCNHAEATFTAARPYDEVKQELAACAGAGKGEARIRVITNAVLFVGAVLEGHAGDRELASTELAAALDEAKGDLGWTLDGIREAVKRRKHPKSMELERMLQALATAKPSERKASVMRLLARL